MSHTVTLLPGDGIGPEVAAAAHAASALDWLLRHGMELDDVRIMGLDEKACDAIFDDARNWELVARLVADPDARVQYVFVARTGVIWRPVDGALRRARFTHCAHFETRHGALAVDSQGTVRALPARDSASAPAADAREHT